MDILGIVIIAAILVESLVSAAKPLWDESKRGIAWGAVASLGAGLIIAFAANLDIAGAMGITIEWAILPQLISGIIISRGSNFVYDIFDKLNNSNDAGK